MRGRSLTTRGPKAGGWSAAVKTGCPAQTPGGCNPWQPFPHAQFTLTRLNADGTSQPGTTRTIESNDNAHFAIRLHPGSYLLQPDAGTDTKGGSPLRLSIKALTATTVTVRYTAKFRRA